MFFVLDLGVWSIGLGSWSLLADFLLGLPCDIDPEPCSPRRIGARYIFQDDFMDVL